MDRSDSDNGRSIAKELVTCSRIPHVSEAEASVLRHTLSVLTLYLCHCLNSKWEDLREGARGRYVFFKYLFPLIFIGIGTLWLHWLGKDSSLNQVYDSTAPRPLWAKAQLEAQLEARVGVP